MPLQIVRNGIFRRLLFRFFYIAYARNPVAA